MQIDNVVKIKAVGSAEDGDDVILLRDGDLVAVSLPDFTGPQGEPGTNGKDGKDGRDGVDGKDGLVGPQGAPGTAGMNGLDGTPGADGRDGLDGLPGAPGGSGQGFQWRGQYSSKVTYQPGDTVRFSGSAYVCVKETTGVYPSVASADGFGKGKSEFWDMMAVQGDGGTVGAQGPAGAAGAAGPGVPAGGLADQVLTKVSDTDYDTHWVTGGGGGGYTTENAQDDIGTILVDTATIDFTYSDATPSITADVKSASIDTTQLKDAGVTLAKMANMTTSSLIYRKTAGTGVPEVNTLATLKTDLGLAGTNSGDQTITLTSDVTGSGTGSFATTVAAIAGTSVTGTTGTGNVVFKTSPTLTTPVLGIATATSLNKVAITAPAAGSTLTIQDGFTLTANGNATVSGTNTGDQTITLTSDVTGSGTGSFATTIANNAVTYAKMQTQADQTFLANNAGSTTIPQAVTIANAKTMLGLTGTNSGDQTITLTGAVTGSGTGSFATTYSTVPINKGGTGQTTAGAAFDALSPMTTGGDLIYGGASGTATRLANGTSGWFLKSQGTTLAPVWAAVPGGGDALTTNSLAQFAATTSLELKGVISDETGSGALVFATSPTLVTPILGTPTSGTLTNCTIPVGGVTGLGTGVGTFLTTPSSANLAAALTDETGSGAAVFATSPTLVTPILGTPTSGTLTNCTGLPVAGGGTGATTLTSHGILLGHGTSAVDATAAGTAGQLLKSGGSGADPAWADNVAVLTFVIDGGGSAITTGIKGDLEVPFACTINRATLLADQSGSIVVDIWKDTYANYPPTIGDVITASAPPTISTATKSQDSTLTGWTTSISAGDTLRFNVNSITTITRVTLSLKVTKT